jgi:Pyruvate/2-oxoacid:ferredoxin oxidoreductase gamma subunit
MFQMRIHVRGGQGVVSGAKMLSVAAFLEGKYAQAFPGFGLDRPRQRSLGLIQVNISNRYGVKQRGLSRVTIPDLPGVSH